jgi:hypothetical protein
MRFNQASLMTNEDKMIFYIIYLSVKTKLDKTGKAR